MVDLYTRGLPGSARADWRAEIASDLWEQRAAFGDGLETEVAILSRCLRGIPADLSWRQSRRWGQRMPTPCLVARGIGWSFALLSYLFLVATHGFGATAFVGLELYGSDWEPGDIEVFSRISAVVLVLLVAGVLLLNRLPRIGAALVTLGALVTPIAYWWGAPIYGPIGLAVTATSVVLARRSRTRQLRARAATGCAVSVGVVPTWIPRASSASFFACAVPEEPEMIAPACPIVFPGGA